MDHYEPKFPPESIKDLLMYNSQEVLLGYKSVSHLAPLFTDEFSLEAFPPGYRWGVACAFRDMSDVDDGYDVYRFTYRDMYGQALH